MNPFPAPASFPFANLAQAQSWSYFRLPVSIETLLETHRKNAAAWTSASDVAFDALSTLAQRQRDLLKTTVDQYGKVAKDVMAAPSLTVRAERHADAVKHIYDSTVTGFRDLGDIATRANVDAVDILNARLNEGFDELKMLFGVPASRATPKSTATLRRSKRRQASRRSLPLSLLKLRMSPGSRMRKQRWSPLPPRRPPLGPGGLRRA